MKRPKRRANGTSVFDDAAEFRPNVTPRELFEGGAFGGTYFRPITSFDGERVRNQHRDIAELDGLDASSLLTRTEYDASVNKTPEMLR